MTGCGGKGKKENEAIPGSDSSNVAETPTQTDAGVRTWNQPLGILNYTTCYGKVFERLYSGGTPNLVASQIGIRILRML